MTKDKWFLNGGRGSGKSFRLLCETYENKIAELEKENAELRAKESFVGDQNRKLCEQQQKIEVLEEKIAELKEKLKPENCLKLLAKEGYIKFTSDQLTKAKELLKQWLQTSKASGCYNINIVTDTEQFLSEVEKCGQ